jgi:hypothetical protein
MLYMIDHHKQAIIRMDRVDHRDDDNRQPRSYRATTTS